MQKQQRHENIKSQDLVANEPMKENGSKGVRTSAAFSYVRGGAGGRQRFCEVTTRTADGRSPLYVAAEKGSTDVRVCDELVR